MAGLTKHLSGTYQYGGHGMERVAARSLAESLSGDARSLGAAPITAPVVVTAEPTAVAPLSPDAERSFIVTLFHQMVADKALPKYQFERRVDAILAVLLPDLLSQLEGGDIRYVLSEFPLKKVTGNQSTNVDHVYFDHAAERWLFCEIKTDASSVRHDQIGIYLEAVRAGMPSLVDGVRTIRTATLQPGKYTALLQRLERLPLDRPLSLIYLAPALGMKSLAPSVRVLSYGELAEFEHRQHPEAWSAFRSLLIPALR